MLQMRVKGNSGFNIKIGEFSGKSTSTIYFDFKYSTPLFLLENLNYNPNNNDEKWFIIIEPALFDYKKHHAYHYWSAYNFFWNVLIILNNLPLFLLENYYQGCRRIAGR